jgi:hypothetical protein
MVKNVDTEAPTTGKPELKETATKKSDSKSVAKQSKPAPHELSAEDWAKHYANEYGPAHHRGLSKTEMAKRRKAIEELAKKDPDNENIQKHIARLNHLLG